MSKKNKLPQIELKVLESGKVRIHWFQLAEAGPITTPGRAVQTEIGPLKLGGITGRIACQPERRDALPQMVQGRILVTPHSNETRAVTCPECQATEAFKATHAELEKMLAETSAA